MILEKANTIKSIIMKKVKKERVYKNKTGLINSVPVEAIKIAYEASKSQGMKIGYWVGNLILSNQPGEEPTNKEMLLMPSNKVISSEELEIIINDITRISVLVKSLLDTQMRKNKPWWRRKEI